MRNQIKLCSIACTLIFIGFGLISCEKEEINTRLGEPISEENIFSYEDTVYCPNIIDYRNEIIISNWEVQKRNLHVTDIDFFDESFGVMSSTSSVYITHDGGNNWLYQPTSLNQSFFKVATFGIDKFYLSRIGIHQTTDGGENYERVGIEEAGGSIFNFYFFDSTNAIISHGGSIKITQNRGQSWIKKEGIEGNLIQFLDNKIGYIAGGYSGSGIAGGFFSYGEIFKTTDGEESWSRLNVNPLEITAMYFTDANTGIFTDFNGIVYQTIDGGETWQIINDALCGYGMQDMIFTDENTGYLASIDGIIFKTQDGGHTWKVDYYSGEKDSYGNHLGTWTLAKTPNNKVYVAGEIVMKRLD